MARFESPEAILAKARPELAVNQRMVWAELHAMYSKKAQRVGMTLDAYCHRFNIKQVWV